MAFRRPLKLTAANHLQEMSDAEINALRDYARYLYGTSPSVDLSHVANSGNLDAISDTRKSAGAYQSFTTRYPTEAETAEPGTVTTTYDRITQSSDGTTDPGDPNSVEYPAYYDGGNIRAMTQIDFWDTIIYPAIDTLTNGSDQPGTYRIHTSNSLSGHTLISSSPVFSDTRANVGAYSAGSIPEALDQPTTVTNYYLFRTNSGSQPAFTTPVKVRSDGNLSVYSSSGIQSTIRDNIKYVAEHVTGSRIRYRINGAGNNRGSGMTDTRLNGSGNYQTRFVNADDYRAQEFPDGTAVAISTYYLRIYQV